MKFLLGKKIGMAQVFDEKGNRIPVTLLEAGPCVVTQIKTPEKDKYSAVQIGYLPKKKHLKKTEKTKEFRFIREQRIEDKEQLKVGDTIDVAVFQEGDEVKISGISKGKGFQGAVKRWGFKGRLSATHGTKHELRTLGSVGSSVPERVLKGRKMPGRMGSERTTIRNLEIVKVDKEHNLLAIKGALPGAKGALLEISS